MSFDTDDDVRRDETDELHGIEREWFPTTPNGNEARDFVCCSPWCDDTPATVRVFMGEFTGEAFCSKHAPVGVLS